MDGQNCQMDQMVQMAPMSATTPKRTFRLNFLVTLCMIGLIPMIVTAIILCIFSIKKTSANLEKDVYNELHVAAEGLNRYYAWDIVNLGEPTYEHDYVDSLKFENVELTLFMEDTRFSTSIVDKSTGERNEGTKADAEIYKQVCSGKDYKSDGVMIGGKKYYVYYTPIYGADGQVAGMAFSGKAEDTVKNAIRESAQGMVVITIVLCIILCIIIVALAVRIRKPIVGIAEETKKLAAGDLSGQIVLDSKISEVHDLIQAASHLKTSLSGVISGVNMNATELDENMVTVTNRVDTCNEASNGVVSAVEAITQGASDMANSVETCSESVKDMGTNISQIADLAEIVKDNTVEVKEVSNTAISQLDELAKANVNTIDVSNEVVEGINEANQAAEKIKVAAEVITGIASETNLLALNASIEAARAGEAGAGFAVVASSIQSLANQSDNAAKEIQDIISHVIRISNNNVTLANNIKEVIDAEGHVLKSVNDSFGVVNYKIDDVSKEITQISQMAEDLEKAKDVVIDEISNLSAISEENAASCEETNASMEELKANVEEIYDNAIGTKTVSGQLTQAVSYFNL